LVKRRFTEPSRFREAVFFARAPAGAKVAPAMPDFMSRVLGPPWLTLDVSKARGFASALSLVLLATVLVGVLFWLFHVERIVGVYLIPVLISAIRWGLWPGLFAAFTSVALIGALFAKTSSPVFLSLDWEQIVRFAVFGVVALVASRLAHTVKQHAETAERATSEVRRRAETEQLRDALIGSVSHELRTPLSSILGATTVLASAPTVNADPKLQGLAGVVREETERLNNVIQNLLDATRISSDGLRPRFEWAEVADIVNAAIERRDARTAGRAVEVDLARELPLVYVDQVLIEQALGHIIENAAKYSPAGTPIQVSCRVEDGALLITVSDRGAGLTAEEKARLGERFFRGDRTAATTTGSGLGVWIARAFLHANGGSLEAISGGVDRGATFILRLPIPAQRPVAEEAGHE
jgi:K+-sensing histidine kinase KdpD